MATRIFGRLLLATIGLLALGAWFVVPQATRSAALLWAQDDPAALANIRLESVFDGATADREIAAALNASDIELAQSFLDLADARGVPVADDLRARILQQSSTLAVAARGAVGFVTGFVGGEPDDLASLAGTVTGDLFVFGDVRDALREGGRLARGEQVNELVLGLACVGLAITAGTYATVGAAAPARIGASVVKAASKTGRMTAEMTAALMRPLREIVDTSAVRHALGSGAVLQPALAVRAVREAVKVEKAHDVLRMAGDIGHVQAKAGTRAALDGFRVAQGPRDVAKLARLADTHGGGTRAVLKLLGRGALVLGLGAFQLASWLFWAVLNAIFLIAALKAAVERWTARSIHRRKLKSARRLAEPAAAV